MNKFITIVSLISVLLMIFSGEIKAQNDMEEKSIKNEFYKNENRETLYKGKYAGKIKQDNTEFFHFQFDGVLKGKMRFLNIYFETNTDKEAEKLAFCKETKKITEGTLAYLLFKLSEQEPSDISYKLKNQITHTINYDFSKLPQSPDIFFENAYAETEQIRDTVFVVSMCANSFSDRFTVELIVWFKNDKGNYYPERYKTFINKKAI